MSAKKYEYTFAAAQKMVAAGLMDQAVMQKKIEEGIIEPSPAERRILSLPAAVQNEARQLVSLLEAQASLFREVGFSPVLQFRALNESSTTTDEDNA